MYAVGRLGSYISRGVYTVSGPFHPFGGAVDIIVVEQEDGSFKSSAWNIRFGKFQGVLKTKEKVVNINVNGEEAKFHMYLNHKGEAYFLRQVGVEEGESVLYPSSSGDETDEQSQENRQPLTLSRINSKALSRTNSRRSRIFRIFGSRSIKERKLEEGEKGDDGTIKRTASLERAEFAANLLEVKWSTSLATNKPKKDKASRFSCPDMSGIEINGDMQIDSEKSLVSSSLPVTRVPSDVGESLIGETEQVFDEKDVLLPGSGIAQKGGEIDRVQSFIYCESSESSIEGIDGASEGTHETLYIARRGSGQVLVHAESVHARTELLSKDTVTEQLIENAAMEVRPVEVPETYSQETAAHSCTGNHNADLEGPASVLQPVGSEEEQFLFSDHEELKITKVQCMESSSSLCEDGENSLSCSPEGSKELNGSVNTNYESYSSPEKFVQENPSIDFEKSIGKLKVTSSTIDIPRNHKAADEEAGRLVESLPIMWPQIDNLSAIDLHYPLSHSLDSNAKPLKWIGQSKDDLSCRELERDKEQQLALEKPDIENAKGSVELKDGPDNPAVGMVSFVKEQIFEPKGMIAVDRVEKNISGDPSKASVASGGSWKLWPFAFRRSNSRKAMQPDLNDGRNPDAGNASESTVSMDGDKNMPTTKGMKKMERATTPTSEQLASLNLKEGKNTVTFTFSTAMLGEQQVDARIYLWKWNTRIVISDVDGTITKSDVLGQFMPLVGVDWSQTGVTHLFSAIKENGYQLLFLSARAISQAYITRQFLFNLKQDGKALPDGPVVISPDGLFPSLYREVIRRAPHEFKISCLEDIKSLFPSDCNPFYAGFGNRDTDEFSYLRVGIPKGKIFIINPKGEIAVNRSVDTKSYTSFHALVNGMFPPATSSEQEDFNSWNFWKLPPPNLDD